MLKRYFLFLILAFHLLVVPLQATQSGLFIVVKEVAGLLASWAFGKAIDYSIDYVKDKIRESDREFEKAFKNEMSYSDKVDLLKLQNSYREILSLLETKNYDTYENKRKIQNLLSSNSKIMDRLDNIENTLSILKKDVAETKEKVSGLIYDFKTANLLGLYFSGFLVDGDSFDERANDYIGDSSYFFMGGEVSYQLVINRLFYFKLGGAFHPGSKDEIFQEYGRKNIKIGKVELSGYNLNFSAGINLWGISDWIFQAGGGYIIQSYKMKLSIEGDNFLKISKSKSTSNPFVTLTVGRIANPIAVVVGWDSIFGDDKLSSGQMRLGMLIFMK